MEMLTSSEEAITMSDAPEFRWLERGDGDAEPILFLHGLLGGMDHWEPVLERLAGICRPMSLALPILDPRLADASIESLARHVEGFLDAVGLRRAVLGGNSLGGHVALEVALARPDRVSGLVLTGSSGLFERGFTRGVPHRPSTGYVRARMEEVFYRPDLVTPEWVESVRQTLTSRTSALRVLRVARDARRQSVEERLPAVDAPTLLVWGLDDRITPPAVARRFRALMPHSELVLLSHCGHAPMLERPDEFSEAVEEWLRASRTRRRLMPALVGGGR